MKKIKTFVTNKDLSDPFFIMAGSEVLPCDEGFILIETSIHNTPEQLEEITKGSVSILAQDVEEKSNQKIKPIPEEKIIKFTVDNQNELF